MFFYSSMMETYFGNITCYSVREKPLLDLVVKAAKAGSSLTLYPSAKSG